MKIDEAGARLRDLRDMNKVYQDILKQPESVFHDDVLIRTLIARNNTEIENIEELMWLQELEDQYNGEGGLNNERH